MNMINVESPYIATLKARQDERARYNRLLTATFALAVVAIAGWVAFLAVIGAWGMPR
jgi:hypothetical protein